MHAIWGELTLDVDALLIIASAQVRYKIPHEAMKPLPITYFNLLRHIWAALVYRDVDVAQQFMCHKLH